MMREAPEATWATHMACPRCHQTFSVVRGEKPSHYVEHECERGPDIALIVTTKKENV